MQAVHRLSAQNSVGRSGQHWPGEQAWCRRSPILVLIVVHFGSSPLFSAAWAATAFLRLLFDSSAQTQMKSASMGNFNWLNMDGGPILASPRITWVSALLLLAHPLLRGDAELNSGGRFMSCAAGRSRSRCDPSRPRFYPGQARGRATSCPETLPGWLLSRRHVKAAGCADCRRHGCNSLARGH